MVSIENICLTFDDQTIFDHISCVINNHDRIGLVGANGSGKSTLLRIIAGQQKPDSGTIQKTSDTKIGYMPQELTLASTKTILDEAIINCDYDETNEQAIRAQAKKILLGLGFKTEQLLQPVTSLSVGWKMRLLLGQLLLQNADFYLFDEPTNHLDIVAQEWFLDFLKNARFGFILVCHDRYFLDQLCTHIFELENAQLTKYRGNYTSYQEQKNHQLQILQASYNNQQRDIERKQRTIDRFRAQASRARMVKKMERDLEKIERIQLPVNVKTIHFSFPPAPASGKIVLDVHDAQFSFGQKTVFNHVSFTIMRGERVAVIAPNGYGKTTLFNIIAGVYKLQHGSAQLGHNVTLAYFKQDQLQALDPQKTIFETAYDGASNIHPQEIKNLLGCFLFSNDAINKKTAVLSGGEKNRVCMINTLLKQANFLLLDEPTNHLDIQSKDILLHALQKYHGTILFVSHDHSFVNALATSILELTPTSVHKYQGTYEQFLEHKKSSASQPEQQQKVPAIKKERKEHSISSGQAGELKKLESQIKKLEKIIEQTTTELERLSYGTKEFDIASAKLAQKQKELDQVLIEWERLYERVE